MKAVADEAGIQIIGDISRTSFKACDQMQQHRSKPEHLKMLDSLGAHKTMTHFHIGLGRLRAPRVDGQLIQVQ